MFCLGGVEQILRFFAYHKSWLFLLVIKSSNLIIQKNIGINLRTYITELDTPI